MLLRSILSLFLLFAANGALAQGDCRTPADLQALANGLGQGVNAARQGQGLRALRADRNLMQAAQIHACDIARHGRMTHQGGDGSNSAQRAERAGFDTCLTAENLAWGFPRAEQIVAGWLGSAGHRRNILLDRATHYGIGIAEGPQGPMWVMLYARQC